MKKSHLPSKLIIEKPLAGRTFFLQPYLLNWPLIYLMRSLQQDKAKLEKHFYIIFGDLYLCFIQVKEYVIAIKPNIGQNPFFSLRQNDIWV